MGFHLGILVVSWGFLEAPRAHLVPSCELSKINKIMILVLEFQKLKIIISFFTFLRWWRATESKVGVNIDVVPSQGREGGREFGLDGHTRGPFPGPLPLFSRNTPLEKLKSL